MLKPDPRFAVIIPVYNGAASIARAIDSCLSQTVLPDELIVVDDASADETERIVSNFSSPLIRYLRNPTNAGPSASRNRAMDYATANWILFLDADDVFHPNKIEIIRDCIVSHPQLRAIGHSFSVGSITKIGSGAVPPLQLISTQQVLMRNPVVTPALCVRGDNNIRFNEAMSYAEDHDFVLRTTEQFGLWLLNLPLCALDRKPLTAGGLSSNRWWMRKGEINMYLDYCRRHKLYPLMPFLVLFSLLKHAKQFVYPVKAGLF